MPTSELPAPLGVRGTYEAPVAFVTAAYEAIGKLIVEYASTEVAIASTIEKFIADRLDTSGYKVARDITAALVGSSRMERAKSLAALLVERSGFEAEHKASIRKTNVQLGIIQKFRNLISHHGAHPHWYDDRWSVQTSNKYNVIDYSKREMTRYTIEDIERALFDLDTCWMKVSFALMPELRNAYTLSAPKDRHLEEFRFKDNDIIRVPMPG